MTATSLVEAKKVPVLNVNSRNRECPARIAEVCELLELSGYSIHRDSSSLAQLFKKSEAKALWLGLHPDEQEMIRDLKSILRVDTGPRNGRDLKEWREIHNFYELDLLVGVRSKDVMISRHDVKDPRLVPFVKLFNAAQCALVKQLYSEFKPSENIPLRCLRISREKYLTLFKLIDRKLEREAAVENAAPISQKPSHVELSYIEHRTKLAKLMQPLQEAFKAARRWCSGSAIAQAY